MPATARPERKLPKRRGSILFTLLVVLVLVALGPLALVSKKLIDHNKEALKTSQQEYQLLLASSIAGELDSRVDGLRRDLARVARALGVPVARPAPARENEVRTILSQVADERLIYLRYIDLQGWHVASNPPAEGSPEIERLFFTSLRKVAESLAARRDGGPEAVWLSEPIPFGGKPERAALVMSGAVVSGGSFRGVLSVLVDLQSVWEQVVAGHHTGHAIYAITATGRMFASNQEALLERPAVAHSELVERFLNAPGRATETLPFVLEENGRQEPYIGSYEVTQQGWAVFVHAEERKAYQAVSAMVQNTMFWALLAVSVAIFFAAVIARTVSYPINTLAAASRAFAEGDFSQRVQVRARNEVGELGEAFNRMAADLEEHIRRLKRAAEENNELFLGTIRALAQAIDAKDPYTRGHSVRVNRYSVILAQYMGLSSEDERSVHVASLLHDVGKIGVDDAILKKPAPLTREEFEVMKTHTTLGAGIMAPIPKMKNIIPGLRSHHERWRGGGYPDNLQGDAIPVLARIIAVADTFDAMTTNRPYQKAMDFDSAVARLNELRGVVLDERIVDAFNRAYRAGKFQRQENPAPQPLAVTL